MNDSRQPQLTPLDEWGTEAANILGGGDHSAGLGLRMARGVIRASNGELSDEAFHEKYHRVVVAEFGKDARPTEPEGFDK